jgi:transcriptional regulator with XRE-family HTH domain
VDIRDEVRAFLASRRAKLTPERAGIAHHGQRRKVSGLRREEVADLAGVSIDYYRRLEKGNLRGVSDSVLDSVANALQLDAAERAHLFDLARASRGEGRPSARDEPAKIDDSVQQILDSMSASVAFVANGRLDILATNALARAFFARVLARRDCPPNFARYCFLERDSEAFYPDWSEAADITVAILRTTAGRYPDDEHLSDLVDDLATRSLEFRSRWAAHNVRLHQRGSKTFHHPIVGDVTLDYNTMMLGFDDLAITAYTAPPHSESEDRLRILASWTATPDGPLPTSAENGVDL